MTDGSAAFDEALLARIEDAGINAIAPRQQRWIDGWLVRFAPGKAKRARCIQAVSAGRLAVAEKLRLCERVYAEAGLHPFVRITPFSQPPRVDEQLAGMGMQRFDHTRVMAMRLASPRPAMAPISSAVAATTTLEFVAWIGAARQSSPAEIAAHRERVEQSPVTHRCLLVRDAKGRPLAGGQVAIEDDIAGLYDVFTEPAQRRRGHGETVCRALLQLAASEGALLGYLQVDAANEEAHRIYRRMGFVDAYAYHYRSPPKPAP